jgi:hypothetical protein
MVMSVGSTRVDEYQLHHQGIVKGLVRGQAIATTTPASPGMERGLCRTR